MSTGVIIAAAGVALIVIVELKRIADSLEKIATHAGRQDELLSRDLERLDRIDNATGQGRR